MNTEKIEKMARERGRPFRILVVDDEPRVRDVFREFCEVTHSVVVDAAVDGKDAVGKVQKGEYDLVTMDLIMPEMSGVEAVTKIKKMKPYLPVIIITGNATERLIREAGIEGGASLMYKPVMLEDFVEEVTAALEKANLSRD